MADMCLYEPIYGDYPKNCNGACKRGKDKYCPYYFEDPICKIMKEWKNEAKVDTPILTKYDKKRKKFLIYTNRPGFMIGYHGKLYYKYGEILNKELITYFIDHNGIPKQQNFIEFVDCDDVIE